MKILLTNDDGVFAEGIKVLAEALSALGEVWTIAPDRERSAASHSLTLDRPLRIQEVAPNSWAVTGTPTDCVNIGVLHIMKDGPPDLVVSGINFGVNMGDDVTYSGTVSAAFEGNILDLPSLAISQEIGSPMPYERSARIVRHLVESLKAKSLLSPDLLLNVNFPFAEPADVLWTHLGKRRYQDGVVEKVDPRGKKYYWIGGVPEPGKLEKGTDFFALAHSQISITPLHLDLTDYGSLESLKETTLSLP